MEEEGGETEPQLDDPITPTLVQKHEEHRHHEDNTDHYQRVGESLSELLRVTDVPLLVKRGVDEIRALVLRVVRHRFDRCHDDEETNGHGHDQHQNTFRTVLEIFFVRLSFVGFFVYDHRLLLWWSAGLL